MNEIVIWFFEGVIIAGLIIWIVEIMAKKSIATYRGVKPVKDKLKKVKNLQKENVICCNKKCVLQKDGYL